MRCNKARQEIIWERHHGAGSVVPFSLQAGNDIFFRFYLTKAELLALTAADFNFDKETVTINKSYQRLHGEERPYLYGNKELSPSRDGQGRKSRRGETHTDSRFAPQPHQSVD